MSTPHYVHGRALLEALFASASSGVTLSVRPALAQADPLRSWNDGRARQSIVSFVTAVTREGSPDFVPVPQRVAMFDDDGTLWLARLCLRPTRHVAVVAPAAGYMTRSDRTSLSWDR
jgi:hypothetical protein